MLRYYSLINSRQVGRSFCADASVKPNKIFQLVAQNDVKGALAMCEEFAKPLNLSPGEFLSKQCSERSYLIYRLSVDSRAAALEIAQSGSAFPDGVSAEELLVREGLWDDDVKEQYHRAVNCMNLSFTSLSLSSPNPARDYQIIGKSVVWKLLFGRSACVLQAYLSRCLQASNKPYEFAIANHRKAARLFDDELSGPGPTGPLEEPEKAHDVAIFQQWSEKRISAAKQHMRLIVHLTSDVARYVESKSRGKALIEAATAFLMEELDDEKEKAYARGVFQSTMKYL